MFDLKSLRTEKFRLPVVVETIQTTDKPLYRRLTSLMKDNGWEAKQALWHLVFPEGRTTCSRIECDETPAFLRNTRDGWGYRKYCCNSCAQGAPEIYARKQATWKDKYGVDNPAKSQLIKDKTIITNQKRYGTDYTQQNKKVRAKGKRTNLKRYGVEHIFQNPDVVAKAKATLLERYGVEHANQHPEFLDKAQRHAFNSSVIKLKGKKFKIQGYEGHALKVLVDQLGVPVTNITTKTSNQKEIWWEYKNKRHRYHTDIRINYKGKDISLEVKSLYTVGLKHKETFNQVKRKAKGAFELGVDLRIWVVDPIKKKIIRFSNFHELTHNEMVGRLAN